MSAPQPTVLVVDDEEAIVFGIRRYLENRGYAVETAASTAEARAAVRRTPPDVALIDYALPDGDGLALMRSLRSEDAALPVVMLTGLGSIDLAVKAIKEGAEQFLTKPAELPALATLVDRLVQSRRNARAASAQKARDDRRTPDPFLGDSAAIRALRDDAERVATSAAAVLVEGETGTGKGVLAAWLHRSGPRREEAFVDLNCAGLSKDLLESELFGHEKGAFTGAAARKAGLLEIAHRGTLFLDEVGDLGPEIQPRLLKVLEEKRFRRLGEVQERHVNVRLVTATHRDLSALSAQGAFRQDLLYRIDTLRLRVPALRERGTDVVLLARELALRIAHEIGRPAPSFSGDAERALVAYAWPGNVRELRNALERILIYARGDEVRAEDVLAALPHPAARPAAAEAALSLVESERRHIGQVLKSRQGDVEEAARVLGLSRSALYQKLKKHQIPTRSRASA
jgi:DNA-binding NtrC family response regulator